MSTSGAPSDIESYVFRFFKKGEESNARNVRVAAPITGGTATATLTLAGAEETTWLVKCLALDFHSNESPLSDASNEASLGTPTVAGETDATQNVTIAHSVSNVRKSGTVPGNGGRTVLSYSQKKTQLVTLPEGANAISIMKNITKNPVWAVRKEVEITESSIQSFRYAPGAGGAHVVNATRRLYSLNWSPLSIALNDSLVTTSGIRLTRLALGHFAGNINNAFYSLYLSASRGLSVAARDSSHLLTVAAGSISIELPGPGHSSWDRPNSGVGTVNTGVATSAANPLYGRISAFALAYHGLSAQDKATTTITFHVGSSSRVWKTLPDSGYSATESGADASVRLVSTNKNVATLELSLDVDVNFLSPNGGAAAPVRATASASFSDTLTLEYGI